MANLPDDKHIVCNVNNYIPGKIPSFLYASFNRSVLCNCEIEVENHFLLEYLASCQDVESKLIMYFTVNTAFVKYHDNLTESLKFLILMNRTTHEQTLMINLQSFDLNCDLLKTPKNFKGCCSPVLA